jgi:hypothetical protein
MSDTRLTIYTVLTGAKEALGDPLAELDAGAPPSDLDIDWVCFSDDPDLRSSVWQIRPLDEPLPPERLSRRPKMLPHEYLPDVQWSLYVDNIVRFRRLPTRADLGLTQGSTEQVLCAFRHATRQEPVSEAEAIVQLGYERVGSLVRQLDHYRRLGRLDASGPLSTCTLLLRNHHPPEPALRSDLVGAVPAVRQARPDVLRRLGGAGRRHGAALAGAEERLPLAGQRRQHRQAPGAGQFRRHPLPLALPP